MLSASEVVVETTQMLLEDLEGFGGRDLVRGKHLEVVGLLVLVHLSLSGLDVELWVLISTASEAVAVAVETFLH